MELNAKWAAIVEKRAKSSNLSANSVRVIKTALARAHNYGGYIGDDAAFRSATEWLVKFEEGNTNDWRGNYFIKSREEGKYQWMDYDEIVKLADQELGVFDGDESGVMGMIAEHLETGNRERIGPKGLFKPASQDLAEKIRVIWSPKETPKQLDMDALEAAFEDLRGILPPNSISTVGIDVAMRATPYDATFEDEVEGLDPTTNSGPPWFKRNWSPLGYEPGDKRRARAEMIYSYYRNDAKQALNVLSRGKLYPFTSMAAQRLTQRGPDQLADDKYKRLVVAMFKTDAILCKMVTAMLIPALRQLAVFNGSVRTFAALMDAPFVDISCQHMMGESQGRTILSTDFSGFDQTQIPWIIVRIGEIIASWIRGGNVWVAKLVESMVMNTSILSPVGFFEPGPSSMKSGHGFTNLIDSLISLLNLFYGQRIGAWKIHNAMVQGDDGATDGEDVTPDVFEEVSSHLGLSASNKKQFFEEGAVHYLQRLHLAGKVGGIYSLYRSLGSVLSYERLKFDPDDWNPYLEAMQTISRLDNCAFHPHFERLVEFVAKHDKYELGRNLDPDEVISKAGGLWTEVLHSVEQETINARVDRKKGFATSPANEVLRNRPLPEFGSHERFIHVYGERATKAEEELGTAVKNFAA
jgi:hypothetical protein